MCPVRVSVRATFGEPSLHPAAIEGVFSDCDSPCPAPAPLVVDTTVESPPRVTMEPGATLQRTMPRCSPGQPSDLNNQTNIVLGVFGHAESIGDGPEA